MEEVLVEIDDSVETILLEVETGEGGPTEFIVIEVESAAGIPDGGLAGQILAKLTDNNYEVAWIDAPISSVGLSQIAVGHPTTGVLTSYSNFIYEPTVSGTYSRLQVGEIGSRNGQIYTHGVTGAYSILEAGYLTVSSSLHLRVDYIERMTLTAAGITIPTTATSGNVFLQLGDGTMFKVVENEQGFSNRASLQIAGVVIANYGGVSHISLDAVQGAGVNNLEVKSIYRGLYFSVASTYKYQFHFNNVLKYQITENGIYGDTTVPYLQLIDGGGAYLGYDLGTGNNNHIWFGNNIARITSGRILLQSSTVATDYGVRIDSIGAKVGPISTMLTANNYAFEVQHTTGAALFYVAQQGGSSSDLFFYDAVNSYALRVTNFQGVNLIHNYGAPSANYGIAIGLQHTTYEAFSAKYQYSGGWVSDNSYNARYHYFTGGTSITVNGTSTTLYVAQTASSPYAAGVFFKAANGGNDAVLQVNRGDGTSPSGFANAGLYSFLSFGLADGFNVQGTVADRVKIGAEYESQWNTASSATLHTSFVVQNYSAGVLAERFRVGPNYTVIKPTTVVTDKMLRVDAAGVRIGTISTAGNANSGIFDVGGLFSVTTAAGYGVYLYNAGYGGHYFRVSFDTTSTVLQQYYGSTILKSDSFTGGLGSISLNPNGSIDVTAPYAVSLTGTTYMRIQTSSNNEIEFHNASDSHTANIHYATANRSMTIGVHSGAVEFTTDNYSTYILSLGTASITMRKGLLLAASVAALASLNIPSGTAPTSPVDGDIWFDGTDIKMRIGGVTKTFTLT